MKQLGLLFLLPAVLVLLAACASTPQPAPVVESAPPAASAPPPQTEAAKVEEKAFDPGTISQERMETARADVQELITNLNRLIRAKNYNAWRGYLADSYFREISSAAFLEEKTEELFRRDQIVAQNMGRDPKLVQKKILRTPKDYFDNVVVPSRSNDRMDDIDFVSENRVKAYTVNNQGQRLVLYDLEIVGNKWKIIN